MENTTLVPQSRLWVARRRIRRTYRDLKRKAKIALFVAIPVVLMTFWGTYQVNRFFDHYTLEFRSPVQSPVVVKERPEVLAYEAAAQVAPLWQQLGLTGIEKEICQRFGTECKMALAVSQAENGSRQCDYVNKNKNRTVDVGLFQINTLHFDKYSQRQLVDCGTNLNAAWELYQDQGWNPWVAYLNGSYKKFLR